MNLLTRISIFTLMCLLFQLSCKEKNMQKIKNPTEKKSEHSFDGIERQNLTTVSGKVFELATLPRKDGLIDIHMLPKGFESSQDTLLVSGVDPLSSIFLADLDKNGFEELYLVTTSEGSGSYGNIYGFSSNRDKSVTPVYIPPLTEKDRSPGSLFEGYMGHDSIFLDNGRLMRKFPVYLEGDPNCCPTGGHRVITYALVPGEATWLLKPEIDSAE